jgi:hypothetical protein
VAKVEQPERPADRAEVDATLEGRIGALAPLVAGGAGWRLKDVKVRGTNRWRVRRLSRARRTPLTIDALTRNPATAPDPGLVLAALAAAVDPQLTAGHRFGVEYAIANAGHWTVLAEDGRPLVVKPTNGDKAPRAATITADAAALFALLAGHETTATASGDLRAVETLHGWFDRARGLHAG